MFLNKEQNLSHLLKNVCFRGKKDLFKKKKAGMGISKYRIRIL